MGHFRKKKLFKLSPFSTVQLIVYMHLVRVRVAIVKDWILRFMNRENDVNLTDFKIDFK